MGPHCNTFDVLAQGCANRLSVSWFLKLVKYSHILMYKQTYKKDMLWINVTFICNKCIFEQCVCVSCKNTNGWT